MRQALFTRTGKEDFVEFSARHIAALIDHTLLRPDADEAALRALCNEAVHYGFATATVNSAWASLCAKHLAGSGVRVNACVSFPLGATPTLIKVAEARQAVDDGAGEVDMVINVGALKSGALEYVERDIASVVSAIPGIPVKVILETCYLTREENVLVCQMGMRAGAAFVKTSTGFGPHGATLEDVRLMRNTVGQTCGVKAAGGIRTLEILKAMVDAGAARIGTSAGIRILGELAVEGTS